jgi:hypothetical protein
LLAATLLPIAGRSVLVVVSSGCQFVVACFDMWGWWRSAAKVTMSGMISPGVQVRLIQCASFNWLKETSGPIKPLFDPEPALTTSFVAPCHAE